MRATGTVKRGYLGVAIQPLSTDIAAGLALPKDKGEIVASVEPNGPAAKAGIKQGDGVTPVFGVLAGGAGGGAANGLSLREHCL